MVHSTECHGASSFIYCSSDSENKSLAGVTGVMPLSASCRIREENFFFEVIPNSVSISACRIRLPFPCESCPNAFL